MKFRWPIRFLAFGAFAILGLLVLFLKGQIFTSVISSNQVVDPTFNSFPFLDRVDLYQKSGLVELYGLRYDQTWAAPLEIDNTLVSVVESEGWLLWTPEFSPHASTSLIRVVLSELPSDGRFEVGVLMEDGTVSRWSYDFSSAAGSSSLKASELQNFDQARRLRFLEGKSVPLSLARSNGESILSAETPVSVNSASEQGKIKSWFLRFTSMKTETVVRIRSVGFALKLDPTKNTKTKILGQIGKTSGKSSVGPIFLRSVKGDERQTKSDSQGRFTFEDVETEHPLSIRVSVRGRDRFADRGRWFMPDPGSMSVVIPIVDQYENPSKKPIDTKPTVLRGVEAPGETYPHLEPHAEVVWPGAPAVQNFYREIEPLRKISGPSYQEFLGRTFANNGGFPDKDRFAGNASRCLRIAQVGGSSSVSIQVKVAEKFSLLMEQELAPQLGRCVDVISAGRDNGDIGAVFPIVRDYVMPLKPEVLLIDYMQLLGIQIEPSLLERMHGWNFDYSPLSHFRFDDQGRAVFVPKDDSWPMSVTKPDRITSADSIPFMQTLSLPWKDLSEPARRSFSNLTQILIFYRTAFPNTRIFLHTGPDQARCRSANTCGPLLKLKSGRLVHGGISYFLENVSNACQRAGVVCLHPAIPNFKPGEEDYTYVDDGHFTLRGHQWMANSLAMLLMAQLKAKAEPDAK